MSNYEDQSLDSQIPEKKNSFPIPSDPVQKEKIMSVVRGVSNAMTQIEAHRDFIKDELTAVAKEHQIPKRILNKFVKAYHKSSFAEDVGVNEEFMALTLALQPKAIVPDLQQERPEE